MTNHPLLFLLAILVPMLTACGPAENTGNGPAPAATADAAAPPGRLPAGVTPLFYHLDLLLDPCRDDFSGSVAIDIQLDDPAQQIWLHGKDLRVNSVVATVADGRRITGKYEQVLDSGVAEVSFAETLPAGRFKLRMDYEGDFDRNLAGLFKVEEQGDAYALAKSESIQARRYLPGFDEPGLKAPFAIGLTVPEGYAAISNGREIKRESIGNGLEKITFATTRPMSTYLLSLSVGPFDRVERPAIPASEFRQEPIPLTGYARRGRGADLNYILDITPRMVEIFESQLRRPYPFEKLDIVAAPQWPSGATELSAAITYREQRILVEGQEPAPGARLALLGVHAHEIAHMWFGNLVTPPWWDDLWLKEGFATWGTPLALTLFEPQGGHDLNARVRAIGAMQLDSLASTRAIREPIEDNNQIRNAYDAITYAKSLGVIGMVDQYFGAPRFRPALGRYIEAFADGVAASPDFYSVIGEETNTPELTETFRSFVEQKGVPQLELALDCNREEAVVAISQARYKPLGSPIGDAPVQWSIPLCLRSEAGTQCLMLTEPKQMVALKSGQCPSWLLPNADGSGYYRWNLAAPQWRALLDHFSELTPAETLSVIDSAFAAFEAGSLAEDTLLDVVRKSAASDKRQVVVAPLTYLHKYRSNYVSGASAAAFRQFASALYQPVLDRTAGSEDNEDKLLYSELLSFMALSAEDRAARRQLTEKAAAFTGFQRDREPSALDSDLYQAALSVAVQDAGQEFLPHLLRMRSQLDDPRFDNASANAIGAADKPAQLDTIHQLALGDTVGARETFGLIARAMAEPTLRQQHWRWLRDNFPAVLNKIPVQWRRQAPAFARSFCDRQALEELRQLFEQYGDLAPGYQRSLAQTEERIRLCMAQREQGAALVAAL
ncbi:M1 family metallopeptidase [Microbulbifer sp. 2201CG32-9]|uniref:M1 family metallopeptidase n=1 Tax=Microbulbifer sp. 2201CG32-9 TaxID=3232309 RepID=UPI00345C4A7D